MICILKRSIWDHSNVFYKGTVMVTMEISDHEIQLTNIGNTNKRLNLTPEDFMNEDLIEILEEGV